MSAECDMEARRLSTTGNYALEVRNGRLEEGTHPLCRVILHLQFDASALACHQHASEDTRLDPNLASFTDYQPPRGGPCVKIQTTSPFPGGTVAGVPLQNVHRAFVGDEPVLIFP